VAQTATDAAPDPIEGAQLSTATAVISADDPADSITTQITTTPVHATVTSTSPTGGKVSIELPTTKDQTSGQVVSSRQGDGTIQSVVYASTKDTKPSLVVQPATDGSTRIIEVIPNKKAVHRLTYRMTLPAGAKLVKADDGSIQVISSAETDNMLIGTLSLPWARDAQGNPVPTQYKLKKNAIIQVVSPNKSTIYPITADPWWNPFTWNWHWIGSVTGTKLKQCGLSALGVTGGMAAVNIGINVIRNAAGKYLVSIFGGPWGVVGVAVGSCIAGMLP